MAFNPVPLQRTMEPVKGIYSDVSKTALQHITCSFFSLQQLECMNAFVLIVMDGVLSIAVTINTEGSS